MIKLEPERLYELSGADGRRPLRTNRRKNLHRRKVSEPDDCGGRTRMVVSALRPSRRGPGPGRTRGAIRQNRPMVSSDPDPALGLQATQEVTKPGFSNEPKRHVTNGIKLIEYYGSTKVFHDPTFPNPGNSTADFWNK